MQYCRILEVFWNLLLLGTKIISDDFIIVLDSNTIHYLISEVQAFRYNPSGCIVIKLLEPRIVA